MASSSTGHLYFQSCFPPNVHEDRFPNPIPWTEGQGRPHSLPIRRISALRPSVTDRLAARSITGQRLGIRVHQHFGYKIHFEWNAEKETHRCMERRFMMYSDVDTFCTELCKLGSEGLCKCIYEEYHTIIPAQSPDCLRGPIYNSQTYREKPRWWLKTIEDMALRNLCSCDVTSTDTLLDWPPPIPQTHTINEGRHLSL
jgi:hypothetical protein